MEKRVTPPPSTGMRSSKAGLCVLFRPMGDGDASPTCGIILDMSQRKAVFAGPCQEGEALVSDDGRYVVLVSLPDQAGGDEALAGQGGDRIAVVDLQSMAVRLSWDSFTDLHLVKLTESILRASDAKSGDRSFPLDIRSMPWASRRSLGWGDWPLKDGEEQTAALEAMAAATSPWEENPAFVKAVRNGD